MTKIEEVARAIDASDGLPIWEHADEVVRNSYRRDARAAIEAMREPTDAMVNAPPRPTLANCDEQHYARAWRAMIDAALEEKA